jgi:hypothetical protein
MPLCIVFYVNLSRFRGIVMSSQDDDSRRIMGDKAARASALASRYAGLQGMNNPEAMRAAYAGAGRTLIGAVREAAKEDEASGLPQVACGGSYL